MPNPKGNSGLFSRQVNVGSREAPKLSGKHRFGNNHEATNLLLITFSSLFFSRMKILSRKFLMLWFTQRNFSITRQGTQENLFQNFTLSLKKK